MQSRAKETMIAAVDVYYDEYTATAAAVVFESWGDSWPIDHVLNECDNFDTYQPGYFYKRELPCLLNVLNIIPHPLSTIVIDGYVWLKEPSHLGLGAHLYYTLDQSIAVIGVAKTFLQQAKDVVPITRGKSQRPLYISAAGTATTHAADCIQSMHGAFRIPTLLKMADQLSRKAIS